MSKPQDRMGIHVAIHMRGPHPKSRIVSDGAHIFQEFDGATYELGDEIYAMSLAADADASATLRRIADEIDRGMLLGWTMNERADLEIGAGEWDAPSKEAAG